ncbi:MAG: hypothetical protein ACXWQO_20130 [Bdellovibrionota bacterium]
MKTQFLLFLLFLSAPARANEPIVHLTEHSPPLEHCEDCHMKKTRTFMQPKKQPQRNHAEKNLQHGKGEIACGSCHDAEHSNRLRSSATAPADFTHPSPVCQQCHVDVFRDWARGMHGKRTGGWNREKVQSQCIDCHDPHSVKFKKMQAMPAPKKPKFHIEKEAE